MWNPFFFYDALRNVNRINCSPHRKLHCRYLWYLYKLMKRKGEKQKWTWLKSSNSFERKIKHYLRRGKEISYDITGVKNTLSAVPSFLSFTLELTYLNHHFSSVITSHLNKKSWLSQLQQKKKKRTKFLIHGLQYPCDVCTFSTDVAEK